ncbi:hemolysin family protein [Hoyosella altamirensis]|uniref:CBS domain containing-hemolysin-like protein n=1 Tax=Hoyosella altamirensis TaxID=616997 RepID=A0A839RIT8_9ACTN|nr:hemolysin family protein [Hoyosella altamirensis]MBB3036307.1 CBS domain containing-hemolysin-like protein [Hoyosella altamirensis]
MDVLLSVLIPIASLLGFIALTAGTAMFVAAEFSLTALERTVVDAHAREGDLRARQVQHAHRTLSFQLSGAQLGITLTTLITGYLAEPVLAQFVLPVLTLIGVPESAVGGLSLAIALILATSLSMVFGELVPKNLAISRPLPTARATAGFQAGFSFLFKAAITGLNGTANTMVRRLGIEPADELRSARSPEELIALVRNSAVHGSLDEATATLVDRSLKFGELTAEDLMTPRVKIESLAREDTVADLLSAARRTGHSRFPVTGGDLDDTIGVVHVKEAFTVAPADRTVTPVSRLLQKVPVVPSSLDGDALMDRIRSHGLQIALVVDEYGGTAGVVTMEDLIEEIFGDVRDEHDDTEAEISETSAGWDLSGLLRVDEVEAATGYNAPDGDYETLGGLVLTALGRIPDEGDRVILPASDRSRSSDGFDDAPELWEAIVLRMEGRRIDRVTISRIPESHHPENSEEMSHG